MISPGVGFGPRQREIWAQIVPLLDLGAAAPWDSGPRAGQQVDEVRRADERDDEAGRQLLRARSPCDRRCRRRRAAPRRAAPRPARPRRCRPPTRARAACGATSPTKPTTPTATTARRREQRGHGQRDQPHPLEPDPHQPRGVVVEGEQVELARAASASGSGDREHDRTGDHLRPACGRTSCRTARCRARGCSTGRRGRAAASNSGRRRSQHPDPDEHEAVGVEPPRQARA